MVLVQVVQQEGREVIPVDQTIFGPPTGNCWAACVASVMERPLWTVPNFVVKYSTGHGSYYQDFTDWVVSQGWAVVTCHAPIDVGFGFQAPRRTLTIATGLSPRAKNFLKYPEMQHCIVQEAGGRVVHDPHPSRDEIVGDPSMWEIMWKP